MGAPIFTLMKTCALIVAAGNSTRFGGSVPKQFREVCGRPLLAWTISRFEKAASVDQIVLVVPEESLLFTSEKVVDRYGFDKVVKIVPGGASRQESVRRGLERLSISTGLVAIHDGARPLTSPGDIDTVINLAAKERAAMLAIKTSDTVKRVEDGYILATLDRQRLYLAQTPQVFQYDLIIAAHRDCAKDETMFTDDASLIESRGFKVRVLEPTTTNLKVTTPEDLIMAEALLQREGDE